MYAFHPYSVEPRARIEPLTNITIQYNGPGGALTVGASGGGITLRGSNRFLSASVNLIVYQNGRVTDVSGVALFGGILPVGFGDSIRDALNASPSALEALQELALRLGGCANQGKR